jgi:hypothetical protein
VLALSASVVVAGASGPPAGHGHQHAAAELTPVHDHGLVGHVKSPVVRPPHVDVAQLEDVEDVEEADDNSDVVAAVAPLTGSPATESAPPAAAVAAAPLRPASASFRVPAFTAPGAAPHNPAPSWPDVQLIPPAPLPAPATFVPASRGVAVVPVVTLVVSAFLLGLLAGVRIVRRPG